MSPKLKARCFGGWAGARGSPGGWWGLRWDSRTSLKLGPGQQDHPQCMAVGETGQTPRARREPALTSLPAPKKKVGVRILHASLQEAE